jgi:hypothetical protein
MVDRKKPRPLMDKPSDKGAPPTEIVGMEHIRLDRSYHARQSSQRYVCAAGCCAYAEDGDPFLAQDLLDRTALVEDDDGWFEAARRLPHSQPGRTYLRSGEIAVRHQVQYAKCRDGLQRLLHPGIRNPHLMEGLL